MCTMLGDARSSLCAVRSLSPTRHIRDGVSAGKMPDMTQRPGDRRLSFNEVPEIYDEIRPSYPAALYESLFEMLPSSPVIVEVGPGTGQATKDLLDRGAWVHAVEIGPATAAKLRSNLPTDRLSVTVGDFERVAIAPATFDAVFSATAYHWISPQAQTDRPAAVLRAGGVVAPSSISSKSRQLKTLRRRPTDLRQARGGTPGPTGAQSRSRRPSGMQALRTRRPLR